jgi:hypothetical protein
MNKLRFAFAFALVLTALVASTPRRVSADECINYFACQVSATKGCLCEGFYCGEDFICGIPF